MGLDITAYSDLVHIGLHDKDPELNEGKEDSGWHCYYEYHVNAYAYTGFEASFRGIPILGVEKSGWSNSEFIVGGCYQMTEGTEQHSFRAGSYSGYNAWRDDLRVQFNPKVEPEKPFYELIFFADNEGAIGPEACLDLWEDFVTNRAAYLNVAGDGYDSHYDAMLYDDWTKAFLLGSNNGLVRFH